MVWWAPRKSRVLFASELSRTMTASQAEGYAALGYRATLLIIWRPARLAAHPRSFSRPPASASAVRRRSVAACP